jgi:hypothetical protein
MDSWAHQGPKPPQNLPCTGERSWGPHVIHLEKTHHERPPEGIGQTAIAAPHRGLPRWRTDTANQRGGSEWEPIKILLEGDVNSNKINTTSYTRLRLTTQVGQAHVATGVPLVGVLDRQPTTGSTRSRWLWLAETGNSKEETRGTQFRQVRAARCVIPYVLYVA